MDSLPTTPGEYRAWWESQTEVPYGYCWCGCGKKTSLAKSSNVSRKLVRDCPRRFVHNHNNRLDSLHSLAVRERSKAEHRKRWQEAYPDIEYGFCCCGCNKRTKIAKRSDAGWGHIKGCPLYYVRGHNDMYGTRPDYLPEDRGYETPCWIWQGHVLPAGYALKRKHGVRKLAHRWFYELEYGPIPQGLHLHHLCQNKICVRPSHLTPLSPREHVKAHRG